MKQSIAPIYLEKVYLVTFFINMQTVVLVNKPASGAWIIWLHNLVSLIKAEETKVPHFCAVYQHNNT